MLELKGIHHIAIICSSYEVSKDFYTRILGLKIIRENYRHDRQSFKLDLELEGKYIIELFSFPEYVNRPSRPEALGLRHLAFEVEHIEQSVQWLVQNNIEVEPIREDEFTGKKFTFFTDPDQLPIELYSS